MYTLSEIFGFSWPISPEVEKIDNLALHLEWEYLMIQNKNATRVPVYSQEYSEELFLDIYKYLTSGDIS